MASAWDIISSSLILIIFLGVVYGGIRITRLLSTSTEEQRKSLQSKGLSYSNGKLSVTTDLAAPSREEYLANTRAAFESGARTAALHPDAFRTGPSRGSSGEVPTLGGSSAVDGEKKGFQRGKKLA